MWKGELAVVNYSVNQGNFEHMAIGHGGSRRARPHGIFIPKNNDP